MTEDQFIARVKLDAGKPGAPSDNNYINTVTYDKATNSIYVDEFQNGAETSYQVGVDQQFVDDYISTGGKYHTMLFNATQASNPKRGNGNGGIIIAPTPKASF
jgi:hypothetical protein